MPGALPFRRVATWFLAGNTPAHILVASGVLKAYRGIW
jgi:hypothetical protein